LDFEIGVPIDEVFHLICCDSNDKLKSLPGMTMQHIEGKLLYINLDRSEDVYVATNLPFPFSPRDFLYRSYTKRHEDGSIDIYWRSIKRSLGEQPRSKFRVRGVIKLSGYRLIPVDDNTTRIIYLMCIDLGGFFALDWLHRKSSAQQAKKIIKKYDQFEKIWNEMNEESRVSFKHTTGDVHKSDDDDDDDVVDEDDDDKMVFNSENPLRGNTTTKGSGSDEIEMTAMTKQKKKKCDSAGCRNTDGLKKDNANGYVYCEECWKGYEVGGHSII
jgi:hypothetical protein